MICSLYFVFTSSSFRDEIIVAKTAWANSTIVIFLSFVWSTSGLELLKVLSTKPNVSSINVERKMSSVLKERYSRVRSVQYIWVQYGIVPLQNHFVSLQVQPWPKFIHYEILNPRMTPQINKHSKNKMMLQ